MATIPSYHQDDLYSPTNETL